MASVPFCNRSGLRPQMTSPHPALHAWDTFRGSRSDLRAAVEVTTIKAKAKRAGVYRLAGATASGAAVIAKRCRWPVARIEQTVYQQVLPRVALPHLEFYGVIADPSPEFAWVFLEDAGGGLYNPSDPECRRLAATWLAAMHFSSTDLVGAVGLPDRRPASYLAQLRLTREAIRTSHENRALSPEHRKHLSALSDQLDSIEVRWERIEAACDAFLPALVHGDLAWKNVHLRAAGGAIQFIVLDWETAGWGVPAVDLCQLEGKPVRPDLETYYSLLAEGGCRISSQQVRELARVGGVFRMITSMYWASLWLSSETVERAMLCLASYRECMSDLVDEPRWIVRAS